MVKVSIILPIYNVAPYLEEALDSILHQTLKEIEIIAVNDGSTDNSQEIIEKYQQKDERIIAFQQENQGQSVARNLALQHASGEYIYMMDSDDVLSSSDALQTCYDYAKKNEAEIVFFDREQFTEDHISFTVRVHSTQYA
ncbi:MAG: glycosyltransferase family 2 protein, partial [Prevotella sp.]|nr:glycosyltransferase family 2 protein [Prevotella sp.]